MKLFLFNSILKIWTLCNQEYLRFLVKDNYIINGLTCYWQQNTLWNYVWIKGPHFFLRFGFSFKVILVKIWVKLLISMLSVISEVLDTWIVNQLNNTLIKLIILDFLISVFVTGNHEKKKTCINIKIRTT